MIDIHQDLRARVLRDNAAELYGLDVQPTEAVAP